MINEVAPQFRLKTYEENGETLQYYLYTPTGRSVIIGSDKTQ